jgi:hypothetical protein
LLVVFFLELSQIVPMAQKRYQDEWGTGAREGYEDRGTFRPPRKRQAEPGSPLLRWLGGVAIVGGICWGVYLITATGNSVAALQQNHGPIAIVGLGVISSVVGKYLRG